MSTFNIGDRVLYTYKGCGNGMKSIDGLVGTVVDFNGKNIGVEFDVNINTLYGFGHACEGHGKDGHCRYLDEPELEIIEEKPGRIRWYNKGKLEERLITNFERFLEGNRVGDFFKPPTGPSEIDFIDDVPFITGITLKYKNSNVKVTYYHNDNHDLVKRLKKTSMRSTSEFNLVIQKSMDQIIPSKLDEFTETGKYELYLPNHKMSIIIYVKKKFRNILLFHKGAKHKAEIGIITITTSGVNKCLKKIIIDDEFFLIPEKFVYLYK